MKTLVSAIGITALGFTLGLPVHAMDDEALLDDDEVVSEEVDESGSYPYYEEETNTDVDNNEYNYWTDDSEVETEVGDETGTDAGSEAGDSETDSQEEEGYSPEDGYYDYNYDEHYSYDDE